MQEMSRSVVSSAAIFAFLIAAILQTGCSSRHPSDSDLSLRFEEHRAKFETIVSMAKEDSNATRIAPDFFKPAGAISEQRWATYRTLFDELGLESGLANWRPSGPITLIASSSGLATGGSSKGYAYLEQVPDNLYSSLDQRPEDLQSNDWAYRRIEGNWYLYFVWDD